MTDPSRALGTTRDRHIAQAGTGDATGAWRSDVTTLFLVATQRLDLRRDMSDGGLSTALRRTEMLAIGVAPLNPPHDPASRIGAPGKRRTLAGPESIRSHETTVARIFDCFGEF